MIRGLILLLLALIPAPAAAHEIRPVSLELRELGPGRFAARWKVPAVEERFLAIRPVFDARCTGWERAVPRVAGDNATAHFTLRCRGGLAGTRIGFDNLSRTMVDGMVTIAFANGQMVTQRIRPDQPMLDVPAETSAADVFRQYLVLGVEHILFGADHLLFVLSLVLLVGSWRRLLVTATAFTLAHSITLSLAALGVVHVPVPPVEALIALSILYMAVGLADAGMRPAHPAGRPVWLLAFAFGLLHGLGFASALAEIGLPNHQIPLALLAFNLGVEAGQVAFIAAVLLLRTLLRRAVPRLDPVAVTIATYAIGGMASFWTIERVASF